MDGEERTTKYAKGAKMESKLLLIKAFPLLRNRALDLSIREK